MSHVADAKVAKRYASALFGAASRQGKTDVVQNDLNTLTLLWQQTPSLQRAMESPLIPAEKKQSLLDEIFGSTIDTLTRSFLRLLIDKRRESILTSVKEEYLRQADIARGLMRAHATVAAPISDAQRAELVDGLKKRTGKDIELDVHVDPVILGGVVVRMQDTIIDGSVRGALERLREQMLQG